MAPEYRGSGRVLFIIYGFGEKLVIQAKWSSEDECLVETTLAVRGVCYFWSCLKKRGCILGIWWFAAARCYCKSSFIYIEEMVTRNEREGITAWISKRNIAVGQKMNQAIVNHWFFICKERTVESCVLNIFLNIVTWQYSAGN